MGVVDPFEPVQIQKQDIGRTGFADGARGCNVQRREHLSQTGHEKALVGQPGQRIVHGKVVGTPLSGPGAIQLLPKAVQGGLGLNHLGLQGLAALEGEKQLMGQGWGRP
jgi:hypothetical protein